MLLIFWAKKNTRLFASVQSCQPFPRIMSNSGTSFTIANGKTVMPALFADLLMVTDNWVMELVISMPWLVAWARLSKHED